MHDLQRYELTKIVRPIFESVLKKACPVDIFVDQKITFSDKVAPSGKRPFYEWTSSSALYEAVLGATFPRLEGPVELDHYTSFTALTEIIASSTLQLSSLTTRIDEDEYSTFVKEHGLTGYDAIQPSGESLYEELAQNLFFASLVEPTHPNQVYLWENFANLGRGVRIRLRLRPQVADLRRMAYRGSGPTALKEINDQLAHHSLVYTPWTVSRICAFYLTLGYRDECEIRLLVKRHKGGIDRAKAYGSNQVWPLPIAPVGASTSDEFCRIEVVELIAGRFCSVDRLRDVLRGTPFQETPISQDAN